MVGTEDMSLKLPFRSNMKMKREKMGANIPDSWQTSGNIFISSVTFSNKPQRS